MSTWNAEDYRNRPVTILGGGVLGRRIGTPLYPSPHSIYINT